MGTERKIKQLRRYLKDRTGTVPVPENWQPTEEQFQRALKLVRKGENANGDREGSNPVREQ